MILMILPNKLWRQITLNKRIHDLTTRRIECKYIIIGYTSDRLALLYNRLYRMTRNVESDRHWNNLWDVDCYIRETLETVFNADIIRRELNSLGVWLIGMLNNSGTKLQYLKSCGGHSCGVRVFI